MVVCKPASRDEQHRDVSVQHSEERPEEIAGVLARLSPRRSMCGSSTPGVDERDALPQSTRHGKAPHSGNEYDEPFKHARQTGRLHAPHRVHDHAQYRERGRESDRTNPTAPLGGRAETRSVRMPASMCDIRSV